MKTLPKDTLYFRHDHPDGYQFAEGHPHPDLAEGWVDAPHKIQAPKQAFEHPTLAAFEEALFQERRSCAQLAENNQVLTARSQRAEAENAELRASLARLMASRAPVPRRRRSLLEHLFGRRPTQGAR